MRRDLPHLAALMFNRPLLIRSDVGRQLIDSIGPRVLRGDPLNRADIATEFERSPLEARSGSGSRLAGGGYMALPGIAVLPIVGSLVRRGSWLDAECGMMSYGLITNAVTEILMDSGVRGLMLEFDSGGGEANGCFDCADFIRSASEATGKPVWTHVNEIMCSAAYALGSSGEQIWTARTGEIGSIGVLGAHVDVTERDKMEGVKWTYIYSGEHKVDGFPHTPLTEGAHARIQADCDHLYEMFLDLVSQNRGMTAEEIRATNADIYRGSLAVDAGLADEVGTLDEALQAFAAHVDETQSTGTTVLSGSQLRVGLMAPRNAPNKAASTENEAVESAAVVDPPVTEPVEAPEATESAPEVDEGKVAAIVDKKIKAEQDRSAGLFAVAKQADRLGVTFDAEQAIRKGMSVAEAREVVMNAAAAADSAETSGIAVPKNRAASGSGTGKALSADDRATMWAKHMKRR